MASPRIRALTKAKRTISRDDSLEYFIKFPTSSGAQIEPSIVEQPSTSTAPATTIDESTAIVWNGPNVPVVLLLGWAGCQDRYLMKYSKIYEDRG